MEIVQRDEIDNGNDARSCTKVFAKDGKSLWSKYKKGEISYSKYKNELVKLNGYDNIYDYNNDLSKKKGYEDSNEYYREMSYKRGEHLPMSENRECSQYLGIHICENKEFLSKIINIIEKMPSCNPGYDIVCIKDKKIDVKCACLSNNNQWNFHIKKNKVTDYFLCISFNNREYLNVEHIWLVKGDVVIEKTNAYQSEKFVVNDKDVINIGKGDRALKRWIKHEITDTYKLKEAQNLCDVFKEDRKYL